MGAGGGVAALGGQGAGAVLTPDGSLEAMPVWVTSLALYYQWNDPLSSAFAVALTSLDPAEDRAPDAMKAGGAAHANLLWQVAPPFRVGGEVMYGRRENTDGEAGNATRIQFTVMYTF